MVHNWIWCKFSRRMTHLLRVKLKYPEDATLEWMMTNTVSMIFWFAHDVNSECLKLMSIVRRPQSNNRHFLSALRISIYITNECDRLCFFKLLCAMFDSNITALTIYVRYTQGKLANSIACYVGSWFFILIFIFISG